MKTFLSLLLISTTTLCYSQNKLNNTVIQQQAIQYNNINVDNNVGNLSLNQVNFNNTRNISNPSTARVQQVRSRGNRGSRSNRGNASNVYIQNNDIVANDNVGNIVDNEQSNQTKEQVIVELPQIDLNLNVSLNVPKVNLNIPKINLEKIKEEKVAPKRLEDFRIKTGGNSSSGKVSHKSKKEKKSFQKKVIKPIKCWVQRTFKHNAKFHISCECFKF